MIPNVNQYLPECWSLNHPDNIITWGAHHNWARQNTKVITHLLITSEGMWTSLFVVMQHCWEIERENTLDIYWQGLRSQYLNGLAATSVNMLWYLILVRMLLSESCIDIPVIQSGARIPSLHQSQPRHLISWAPGRRCLWLHCGQFSHCRGQPFRYYIQILFAHCTMIRRDKQ